MDSRVGRVKRGMAWVALVVAVLFLFFSLWRIGARREGGRGPSADASASPGPDTALGRRAVEVERVPRPVAERDSTESESSEEERVPSTAERAKSAEDLRAEAESASRGAAFSSSWLVKISAREGGFSGRLREGDRFGAALAEIADLDGDGFRELAVGAPGDDEAGEDAGAVWILFLGRDGRVREQHELTPLGARLPARSTPATAFGHSLCFLETRELAVARTLVPEVEGEPAAEVWLFELGQDAEIVAKRSVHADDLFGETKPPEVITLVLAAPSGPFAGDRNRLVVGFPAWPEGRVEESGCSGWITHFRLRSDGRTDGTFGCPPMRSGTVNYGRAILLADVYGDGLQLENVAGYRVEENVAGYYVGERGEVLRHSASQPHSSDRTFRLTFPASEDPEDPGFGSSLAWLGDRDGDGSLELAVGLAEKPRAEGASPGGIWIVSIDRKNLRVVRWSSFLPGEHGTSGRARPGDRFGASLATLADRDGDSRVELGIGAPGDDDGDPDAGAIWLLGMGESWTSRR